MTTIAPTTTSAGLAVAVTTGVRYSALRSLAVFAPVEPGLWPTVVMYHGYGNTSEQLDALAAAVAARGAVVFVPGWGASLDPGGLTRGVQEAACAVRFARQHAGDYGGAGDHVVAVGFEAGGYAAALVTLAGEEFATECLADAGFDGRSDALVGIAGSYDIVTAVQSHGTYDEATPEEWERIAPFTYASDARPGVRARLFTGAATDGSFDADSAEAFAALLEAAGVDVVDTVIPGVGHGDLLSPPHPLVIEAVVELMSSPSG